MKSRLILLLIVLCPSAAIFAQDTVFLSRIKDRERLWVTGNVYFTNNPAAHFSKISRSEKWGLIDSLSATPPSGYIWLKTTVYNEQDSDVFLDLDFRAADSIIVFANNADTTFSLGTGPYTDVRSWHYPEEPGLVPIYLKSRQALSLHIRLWSDTGRPFSMTDIYAQTRERSLRTSVEGYRNFVDRIEFNGFFLGAVTFAMLFFLFIFIKVRQKVFLLYGLYLLGAGLYSIVVKTLPYSFIARIAYLNYPLTYKLGEPVQYLFFAAYVAFGKSLLDMNERYGWLNRLTKCFIALLVSAGMLLLTYNFYDFDYPLQQKAFVFSRIAILPFSLLLLIWIILQVRSPVKWFFIAGSSFFFAGSLFAVVVDPKSRHLFFGEVNFNPIVSFKTGILLESLCFALALGYKLRLAQNEKDKASNAYIEQLELNKKMAASETERLEAMVAERTEVVIEKTRLIEEQKQIQLQSTFERQLSEMEMSLLRSQMNPHFIFNSLNSIRYQILKKDYDSAATYLTRFSKLLRYILQNSREHVISLADEIETNRLYVQLESLRFDQGLEFNLDISREIDISEIMVPPMLLQPYIENAVKHGLVPSSRESKKLTITVRPYGEGFIFIVEDNGIGRKASSKRTLLDDKQSLGMRIAGERIELFNFNFQPKIQVNILDLFEGPIPFGTRVTFTYQHNL
ncbi:histidine kinase [Dyadobacter pollutisoli]|uniref:Histidine kinase n=1 Tax=Dyadobacter pollutisoli TaxID=2910158 RepID=A0A9E8NJ34_9BACT|nr:histidine kinase [Dyadobacter pollutisoli]WAC14949.1 histidine kinase [Dyadobacter pollutisoli]